jgi:hypothetical protein
MKKLGRGPSQTQERGGGGGGYFINSSTYMRWIILGRGPTPKEDHHEH